MTDFEGEHPPTEPASPLSANMPHRPADDTEEVYYEGSPLLRGALVKGVSWVVVGLVLIIVPPLAAHLMNKHLPLYVTIGLIVVGLILVSIPPLVAMTIHYRVTNYRIDYERGLIGKDIDTLELWHVEDIRFHQTVADRLLGIGTITIDSHDATTPKLVMHSLPNSRKLFEVLKQRIIGVKRQRGVLKMDTGT